MPAGTLRPSESVVTRDAHSGAEVRQVTTDPSLHHHPFYYLPAYDDEQRYLFFISHTTGRPEVWAELRREANCHGRHAGCLLQLTDHADLAEWSVHPSHDGRFVYFTDPRGIWRVDVRSQRTECLCRVDTGGRSASGMVGPAMGTTSVSRDDRWWAVPIKVGRGYRLLAVDTTTGAHQVVVEAAAIAHPQFHPDDASLLRYAGPYHSRIWMVRRDGRDNRLVYQREPRQWIVHEVWRPGTMEILAADWPHGVLGIDSQSAAVRRVCSFNAWHPTINRTGMRMVCDTTYPDVGLHVFEVAPDSPLLGEPRLLCLSGASNQGDHWDTDHCPYDDAEFQGGRRKVYAPQHTHPHPSFSPDGQWVVFTSDRSGVSQVYEAKVQQTAAE